MQLCISMIFLLIWFGFSALLATAQGSSRSDKVNSLELLDRYIKDYEAQLKSHPENMEMWIKLGEALQSRDIGYHEGGTMQPKALNAYKTALSLNPPEALVRQPLILTYITWYFDNFNGTRYCIEESIYKLQVGFAPLYDG